MSRLSYLFALPTVAPSLGEAPRVATTRWSLSLAGCVLAIVLLSISACGSDSGGGDEDGGNGDGNTMQDSGGSDGADAGSDSGGGNADGGQDSGMPSGTGVANCIKACDTFLMTNCNTPAADFCRSKQQSCEERYAMNPSCKAQLEAMDACAAVQPVARFECPAGLEDPLRPYRVTEDVCVPEANALLICLPL